ncbi:unnamed protein product [Moneuplotes crassus]|uniref:Uncharacterized protein n=1 Tax=Euplotes crassus TaxID=5936 RepID=A0AAD1UDD9_EUPCR|nr:unnamed protein product [Moneuplotes crassus]
MDQHIQEHGTRGYPEDTISIDQKAFIQSLLKSFEKYSDQSNEYFSDTLSFLSENCFLGPLVCSLRAIMDQGYTSFPNYVQFQRAKGQTRKIVFKQFTQSFMSIVSGIIFKSMEDRVKLSRDKTCTGKYKHQQTSHKGTSISTSLGQAHHLQEVSKSTIDIDDHWKNNPNNQLDLDLKENENLLGCNSRLNSLYTTEDKIRTSGTPLNNNFMSMNTITPKKTQNLKHFDKQKINFSTKKYTRGACAKKNKNTRKTSMAEMANPRQKHQRNSSKKGYELKKGTTFRRKGNQMYRFLSQGFSVPTMAFLQKSQASYEHSKSDRKIKYNTQKYSSIGHESTSNPRESIGEYSYGCGGSSFGRSIKKSKFDENQEKICSPGPGRYESSHSRDNSATYSFGKQKKDISFARLCSKDIPSPGKYKIKRDFLSKPSKNK